MTEIEKREQKVEKDTKEKKAEVLVCFVVLPVYELGVHMLDTGSANMAITKKYGN